MTKENNSELDVFVKEHNASIVMRSNLNDDILIKNITQEKTF